MCEDKENIRLAYQLTLVDIRFFKQQEWSLTYYTLLLYSVIIAAVNNSNVLIEAISCLLTLITVLITLALGTLLYVLQISLKKHQEIKESFLNQLPNIKPIYDCQKSNWLEQRFSFIMVSLLIVLGYVFTIFLLRWENRNWLTYLLIFSIPLFIIVLPFCLKQHLFPKTKK